MNQGNPDITSENQTYEADIEADANMTKVLEGLYRDRHSSGRERGNVDDILEEDESDDGNEDNDEDLIPPDNYMPTQAQDPPHGEPFNGDPAGQAPSRWAHPDDTAPRSDVLNNPYIRVVHENGIHYIALVFCTCRGRETTHGDLMAEGLMPTTFRRYRTMFTHAVMDDFRLANLECKASAYQYFQKLRRQTSPMSPETVPNLYHELRRMSRIWRWMKKLKWAGAGHQSEPIGDPGPGELANFCPACPQPGINLPDDWTNDCQRYVCN
jgi:hypothetical protein